MDPEAIQRKKLEHGAVFLLSTVMVKETVTSALRYIGDINYCDIFA